MIIIKRQLLIIMRAFITTTGVNDSFLKRSRVGNFDESFNQIRAQNLRSRLNALSRQEIFRIRHASPRYVTIDRSLLKVSKAYNRNKDVMKSKYTWIGLRIRIHLSSVCEYWFVFGIVYVWSLAIALVLGLSLENRNSPRSLKLNVNRPSVSEAYKWTD